MKKIRELFYKYKKIIAYLFFGVLTTAVNFAVYSILTLFMESTPLKTVIAWFAAVVFAYVTNRYFVFESEEKKTAGVLKELSSFFFCRIITGILDIAIMYLFVDVLFFNEYIMKFISNVAVVILNYIASKIIVFRKTK